MTTERIERADIARILAEHPGNRTFAQTLERIVHDEDLVRVLGRYIFINSPFAGGVANLAGEIAIRQDLFRDPEESVASLADRCTRVAADIFYACIDEFYDRSVPRRDTHRSLAQAALKGIGQYFGFDGAALSEIIQPTADLLEDASKVRDGYGLNQTLETAKLFRAIGFHAGSEILADEEFRILDSFLRARQPKLVTYLEGLKVEIGESELPAYHWIKIHTSVEADHFEFALRGANDALRYYAGTEPETHVKQLILKGFTEFAAVQAGFMEHLY